MTTSGTSSRPTSSVAAVVLAAGASRRLGGRPKQLLLRDGRSLLVRAVDIAREAGCDPVFVVTGAHASRLADETASLAVECVDNPCWQEGIASSIRAGLAAVVERRPRTPAVLLLVCDQPRLDVRVLRGLLDRFDGAAERIVACGYAGTVGVPALFGRGRFDELAALSGDAGAKSVLLRHPEALMTVPWPDGAVDVDEIDDLGSL